MAAQTTYLDNLVAGLPGMIAEGDGGENIISRTIEDSGGVDFGKIVVKGTNSGGVKVPTNGGTFEGIVVRTQAIKDGTDKHKQYDTVSLIRRGVVWVTVYEAVTEGDTAYWKPDGSIGKSEDDGGQAPTPYNEFPMGARFESSAGIGGLAKLRLG